MGPDEMTGMYSNQPELVMSLNEKGHRSDPLFLAVRTGLEPVSSSID